MKLLVGLGNPGDKYQNNRHNIGFMAIDAIAAKHDILPEQFNHKNECDYTKLNIDGIDCILAKPQSYMNNSGIPLAQIAAFYKIPIEQCYVFYDELDIALGKIKWAQGGSNNGHNGLKSIDAHYGKNYHKIKLGIGRPEHKGQVNGHVLSDFSTEQVDKVGDITARITKNINILVQGQREEFLTKFAL